MSYRRLLQLPGASALLAAGLPARLPLAAYAIGLLALGHDRYGTYGAGGAFAAGYTVATIVTGPLHGRWSARPRYRWTLAGLALAHALALGLLLLAAQARVTPWLVGAAAIAVGLLLPPAGVIARARWTRTANRRPEHRPLLESALFLESALDEVVFIVGPTLVTGLGAVLGPGVALAVAGAVATVGCLGLAIPRPPAGLAWSTVERGRAGGLARLGLAFLSVGAVFASIQVAVLSFTAAHGVAWQGGPVLLVFSAASLVAGVLLGARSGERPAAGRHRIALLLLGFGLLPALAAERPAVLALLLLPAALAAAPAVATGYARASQLAGADRAGMALAWCAGALGAGLAVGSVAAGALADAAGWHAVLVLGTVGAAAGWLAARGGPELVGAGPDRPPSTWDGAGRSTQEGEASASVGASRAARSAG